MTLKLLSAQYVTAAIPYLFMLALAGLAWLKAHPFVKNKVVGSIIDRILAAVETAVQAVEQTTVTAMKARNGGPLTPADALLVKNEAVQMAREHLGGGQWIPFAQAILGVDDFQKFLAEHVEAAVQRMQAAPTPVVNVSVPPAKA